MDESVGTANAPPGRVTPVSEIVASRAYFNGRNPRSVEIEDLGKVIAEPEMLVWLGLKEPDEDLLVRVALQLKLDPHVLDDLQAKHRMPKVMDYDTVVLIVAMTVEVRASDGLPSFGETQMLIGSNFLLTIRRGALAPHTELRNRLENMPDRLARGSDFVAAELLDLLIDRHNLANDIFEKSIEPMEQTMLLRGLEKLRSEGYISCGVIFIKCIMRSRRWVKCVDASPISRWHRLMPNPVCNLANYLIASQELTDYSITWGMV